ncbi:hypothetical protein [Nocardia sp. NPDC057030]|uniref:hypothetical protein n=1 Tax=unclassified Nocardia TaxID=2637762 RepID=UPI00362E1041
MTEKDQTADTQAPKAVQGSINNDGVFNNIVTDNPTRKVLNRQKGAGHTDAAPDGT